MDPTAATPVPQAPPPAAEVQRLEYTGKCGRLFAIVVTNIFLCIVTLGIYRFWAKTKLRRYMLSHIKCMGEPFAYLGTGLELFKSFCKFIGIFILPTVIVFTVLTIALKKTPFEPLLHLATTFLYIGFFVLLFYARFKGMRYRLGRTSWRGIRFELRGNVWGYVRLRIKNTILKILTLGFYTPTADIATLNYLVNNIYFGDLAFTYRGQKEELKKQYLTSWLLMLPTLGFSMMWYRAKYLIHIAKYTRLGTMEFRCKIGGGELLRLFLTNILMIVLTLGLAIPYVLHRTARFFADRFKFRGTLDFEKIGQARERSGSEGAEIYLGEGDIGV